MTHSIIKSLNMKYTSALVKVFALSNFSLSDGVKSPVSRSHSFLCDHTMQRESISNFQTTRGHHRGPLSITCYIDLKLDNI